MPLLRRDASRLLTTVNGKPHAGQEDHDDPLPTPRKGKSGNGKQDDGPEDKELSSVPQRKAKSTSLMDGLQQRKEEEEERERKEKERQLHAEPVSDSDLVSPPTRASSKGLDDIQRYLKQAEEDLLHAEPVSDSDLTPPLPKLRNGNLDTIQRVHGEVSDERLRAIAKSDPELKGPPSRRPKQSSNSQLSIQNKKRGASDAGVQPSPKRASRRTAPAKRGLRAPGISHLGNKSTRVSEEREDATGSQSSVKGGSQGDNVFGFDMGCVQQTSKGPKKTFGSKGRRTENIHAPARQKYDEGYKKTSKADGTASGAPNTDTKSEQSDQSESGLSSVMSDSELDEMVVEMMPLEPKSPKQSVKQKRKNQGANSKPWVAKDEELNNLPESKHSKADVPDQSSKPARLLDQLGDWHKDQSHPPESGVPREALANIDAYADGLIEDDPLEGTVCALCKTVVDKHTYEGFWYGKANTVRNQTVFCHVHKEQTARQEYEREGYPAIQWQDVPKRVKKHRNELYKILTNDQPSKYRDRYAPIALTGKAGTARSKRKDLQPEHDDSDEASFVLDDQNTYPGYYGARGRRAMTETIMRELRYEIKKCTDAVVHTSGPAAFVQAVLVPEVAVLLIMEDCQVDREAAELTRENSYQLGLRLHEEIEDEVDVQDSEDENEYLQR